MTRPERVKVGQVLELHRREVKIDPTQEYELIGVYSFGKGIFHREPRFGADLGDYRFFSVEPGDLVLSNIQAWEGAIGFASKVDTGTVGTHRFLTYRPKSDRIDANWARWFFLSEPGMSLIRMAAPGSTMRNRTLAISRFEALEIPLPPLDEQRRVAHLLDRISDLRNSISDRSAHAADLTTALSISVSAQPNLNDAGRRSAGWQRRRLGAVMEQAIDRVDVDLDRAYPNLGIYSFGRGLFTKPDIDGKATSAKILNRIRAGQFIYSRLFAFEGSYGFVPSGFDGYFVSGEFPTFNADPEQLDVRWLATYLKSPERWAELASSSKGLGVRRQRVPIDSVLAYEVWLPPIEEQRTMVERIDIIERCRSRRAESDDCAAALVPASINMAFASTEKA